MAQPPARPMPWAAYLWVLALILVLALLPLASVALAYAVAEPLGCRLDEAGTYPCVFLGIDLGGLLHGMALLGWLMLASLPLGVLGLGLWLAVFGIHVLYRRLATRTKADR